MSINKIKFGKVIIEYEITNLDCWNLKNKKVNENGTIPIKIKYNNKKYYSLSKYVYEIYNSEFKDSNYKIKRSCENKECINPKHLIKYNIGDWRTKELGNKYGNLTVIAYDGDSQDKSRNVTCMCDCGNKITTNISRIRNAGYVPSCGCLRKEKIGNLNKSHGLYKHKIYKTYHNMKSRCYNKNYEKYSEYGGRGIRICDEWLSDFMCFYQWSLENGYSDELSIDRINVHSGYEPNNCRWITMSEQASNKQNTIYVNINNEEICLRTYLNSIGKLSNYESIRDKLVNKKLNIIDILNEY